MSRSLLRAIAALSLGAASLNVAAHAQEIKTVFVIAMENHNWVQPDNKFSGNIQQIYLNPAAPFINDLVNGTAIVTINGEEVNISKQVAYATNYHNVLATPSGNNPHIHPSEPNYLWAEAGTNFNIFNDADPYPNNVQSSTAHLVTALTNAGHTWKTYQEDIDLVSTPTGLTNTVAPRDQWTVPLSSFAGFFASGVNQFNGSNQYNYAAKHNQMVFFSDSNGNGDPTPNNSMVSHYAPLQQLFEDLQNNTVAEYNWITPNQYNDQHTTLSSGYKGLTGDPAKILQGDDFLRQIVPAIMASEAYKNHGAIVIWWDESEGDGVKGDNADNFSHTIGEIVISPRARANVNGLPYASPFNYTHSSDVRTMQEIFRTRETPLLGDAAFSNDLSDLFQPGAVPKKP